MNVNMESNQMVGCNSFIRGWAVVRAETVSHSLTWSQFQTQDKYIDVFMCNCKPSLPSSKPSLQIFFPLLLPPPFELEKPAEKKKGLETKSVTCFCPPFVLAGTSLPFHIHLSQGPAAAQSILAGCPPSLGWRCPPISQSSHSHPCYCNDIQGFFYFSQNPRNTCVLSRMCFILTTQSHYTDPWCHWAEPENQTLNNFNLKTKTLWSIKPNENTGDRQLDKQKNKGDINKLEMNLSGITQSQSALQPFVSVSWWWCPFWNATTHGQHLINNSGGR